MPRDAQSPILIAGPTASGKSALALQLARRHDGIVINADSMQVYRELRILTARPSADEEAIAPHRLYGHVSVAQAYSVARWLDDVATVLDEAKRAGARAIIVGGTGLYFKALTEGLSPVPAIPPAVRQRWREAAKFAGPGELHRMLVERDPAMAVRLAPGDVQRLTRALEVIEGTGRSLAKWQVLPGRPLVDPTRAERLLVNRPRSELQQRCDQRFDAMMAAGALDEVQRLLAQRLPADAPAMRALGVAALAAHLCGRLALDEAVARAKLETHRYVKRQLTWARKHMRDWQAHDDS